MKYSYQVTFETSGSSDLELFEALSIASQEILSNVVVSRMIPSGVPLNLDVTFGEKMNLNDYAKEVHEANKKWWVCLKCDDKGMYMAQLSQSSYIEHVWIKCPFCDGTKVSKRNIGELIALMHSELSEALEGHRKALKDDKLPQWDMVDVEMVDCLIRIMDFLGQKGVDVEKIFMDKMEFNRVREDHKLEARMKEGGKKY